MVKPESYITDEMIEAIRRAIAGAGSLPPPPAVNVSVQWLAGGCRLYRMERAEAQKDCSAVGARVGRENWPPR
jgi:hypothetical protein